MNGLYCNKMLKHDPPPDVSPDDDPDGHEGADDAEDGDDGQDDALRDEEELGALGRIEVAVVVGVLVVR